MAYLGIIESFQVRDATDILFISMVVYHLYIWFRGTQALKALVGLVVLGIIYTGARAWGLFLTTWAFQVLWQVMVILLIVLFQSEIKQALGRVNPLRFIGLHSLAGPSDWIPGLVEAVFSMSKRRIGALLVLEHNDQVREWVTACFPVTGPAAPELLLGLFQKESPLHDGAAIIRAGKVVSAACYLPLTPDEGLPNEWGTRHRAALGLSERCDAWVVVVSEERGTVSLARERQMIHVNKPDELSELIGEAVSPHRRNIPLKQKIHSLLLNRWRLKLGIIALVSAVWLLLAGEQNFQVILQVPVEVKNLPPQLEILHPENHMVEITFQGLRKDASTLDAHAVHPVIEVSSARPGRQVFPITPAQIIFPRNESLHIIHIEPHQVQFLFTKKS